MDSLFQFHDLRGRTLLITGITSGIGRGILPILLSQGLRLAAVSRGMERMRAIRDELGASEDQLQLFDCDLSNPSAVEKASHDILQKLPALDGILNNAGVDPRDHFVRGNDALWNEVFQVNLFAAVSLTRILMPRLAASPQGRILFVGSVLFELGGSCLTAYCATKGALIGLTRSLAHELKNTGITVNCVVPGAIQVEKEAGSKEVTERIEGWQSVPRRLAPADLGGLVCLLLSGAGGAICGQAITVDGGIVHPLAGPEFQGRDLNPPWPLAPE
jgi:3-oxoacyl-[acyl-carrier protein] reductase